MTSLEARLAGLFGVGADVIEIEPIPGGLSHNSWACRVGKRKKYYVKEYQSLQSHELLPSINRLAVLMRRKGVPAPELIRYSPSQPNIVVHAFVEGEPPSQRLSQLRSIARLYSQMVTVGLDRTEWVDSSKYLAELGRVLSLADHDVRAEAENDAALHGEMLEMARRVVRLLGRSLAGKELLHVPVHADFTEKNILMAGDEVRLLCDWDHYRPRFIDEHIATTATRFGTSKPLDGVLERKRVKLFLRSLDQDLLNHVPDRERFSECFAALATMKHIRSYAFRAAVVGRSRPALHERLLRWPLNHCRWLLEEAEAIGDWVADALRASRH